MRRIVRTLTQLTLLSVVASVLTVVSSGVASADNIPPLQWSAPPTIAPVYANIVTSPSGEVTIGCDSYGSGSQDLVTYNSAGTVVRQIPRTSQIDGVTNCITDVIVDKNDTVYGRPWGQTSGGSWIYGPNLLAYDGNTLKWKYPITCENGGVARYVVGADGNIYATTRSNGDVRLIGLTPEVASGQTQPTKVLDVDIPNDCSIKLRPYKDGIVLHGQSSSGAQYYSYAGKFLGTTVGDVWYEKVNAEGWTFIPGYVQGSYRSATITAFNPRTGQNAWTTTVSTSGANVQSLKVFPLAGGGVVALIQEQEMTQGFPTTPTKYVSTLTFLNMSGVVVESFNLPSEYGGDPYVISIDELIPTGNGKVIVVRELSMDSTVSWPYTVPAVVYVGYNSDGTPTGQSGMISGTINAQHQNGYRLDWNGVSMLPTSSNALFLPVRCVEDCSGNYGTKLYPITMSGLGMDYPRGEVLTRSPRPSASYIALGDSFSSGEGVPPFETGTDITGVNTCHKSTAAYPRLIAGTSVKIPSLGTSGFRACSGAVTINITDLAQWNEGIQLDWWPDATTQLVTLTIGGNDIKFADFATACVLSTCQVGSAAYTTSLNEINNLSAKLEATYKRILQYAPNAQVFVLDYPQVVAAKSPSSSYDIRCGYMYNSGANSTGSPHYPWEDAWAARDIVTKLDAKISTAITNVRGLNADYYARLHYVPTNESTQFPGHAACDDYPSYFNNVDQWPGHPSYVFHPNADGQGAYAIVVSSAINTS